jgi:hypothetical protein
VVAVSGATTVRRNVEAGIAAGLAGGAIATVSDETLGELSGKSPTVGTTSRSLFGAGSARTDAGTEGRGKRPAMISSTSRRVLAEAAISSSS